MPLDELRKEVTQKKKQYSEIVKYLDEALERLGRVTRYEVRGDYNRWEREVTDFYGFYIFHKESHYMITPEYIVNFQGKEILKIRSHGPKSEIEVENHVKGDWEKSFEKLMKNPEKTFAAYEKSHPSLKYEKEADSSRMKAENASYRAYASSVRAPTTEDRQRDKERKERESLEKEATKLGLNK